MAVRHILVLSRQLDGILLFHERHVGLERLFVAHPEERLVLFLDEREVKYEF